MNQLQALNFVAAQGNYAHLLPGRLRMEIPTLVDNSPLARSLESRLQARPGVKRVQCSPLTGRALIEFDPKLCQCQDIVSDLYLAPETPILPAAPPLESVAAYTGRTTVGMVMDFVVESSLKLLFGLV